MVQTEEGVALADVEKEAPEGAEQEDAEEGVAAPTEHRQQQAVRAEEWGA